MNGRILDADNDVFAVPAGTYDGDGNPLYKIARAQNRREKILRNVNCLLRTFEGENFVDYEAGIPWYDDVLGNSVLFADGMAQEIKDRIKSVEGISEVLDVRIEIDGRKLSGTYSVRLDDGTVENGRI